MVRGADFTTNLPYLILTENEELHLQKGSMEKLANTENGME